MEKDNYTMVSEPISEYYISVRARRNDPARAITGEELASRMSERLKDLF